MQYNFKNILQYFSYLCSSSFRVNQTVSRLSIGHSVIQYRQQICNCVELTEDYFHPCVYILYITERKLFKRRNKRGKGSLPNQSFLFFFCSSSGDESFDVQKPKILYLAVVWFAPRFRLRLQSIAPFQA